MRLLILIALLALAGCGGGGGGGGDAPIAPPSEPDQSVNIFFCELFGIFISGEVICEGIFVPPTVEVTTPTLSLISSFGCAVRVSWVPSDIPFYTDLRIQWLEAALTSLDAWDNAGFVDIPVALGVLNWEIQLPGSGRWAITMQEKHDGTWRERGRTSVLTVEC